MKHLHNFSSKFFDPNRICGIGHIKIRKGKGIMENEARQTIYGEFSTKSQDWSTLIDSIEFARRLDIEDPLKDYRNLFYYPKKKNLSGVNMKNITDENDECIYFCGQSLGLQLKSMASNVQAAIDNWAEKGVDCHFTGEYSAVFSDQIAKQQMAKLVGAETNEIAFMNGLTVNVHLMIASFYNPTATRNKILMLDSGFHSDWYALESHVTLRGLDPQKCIIFMKPKKGCHTIDSNDILSVIKKEGKHISLIYFEGVHYYTGQLFDLKTITKAGHQQGCVVGYDLAHAVGNVKLQLHDWNVDFAVWCTYKYLNSGPGSMAAVFCHNKHTQGPDQVYPMLRGWWGLDNSRKFKFDKDFTPAEGADRFRLSNPSPVLCAMVSCSISVFNQVGMNKIQRKQRLITGYLEYLLRNNLPLNGPKTTDEPHLQMITPSDPEERGSQISILSSIPIDQCEELLKEHGIVCDIRSPSVIRITPVPLYNTFVEVFKFVHTLKKIWERIDKNEAAE